MYLTDLAFIEEGTPNYTEDGLVNFSKMRMVCFLVEGRDLKTQSILWASGSAALGCQHPQQEPGIRWPLSLHCPS